MAEISPLRRRMIEDMTILCSDSTDGRPYCLVQKCSRGGCRCLTKMLPTCHCSALVPTAS